MTVNGLHVYEIITSDKTTGKVAVVRIGRGCVIYGTAMPGFSMDEALKSLNSYRPLTKK